MERRLTAILSADVVGYSRPMGVDEGGTLERFNSGPVRLTIDKETSLGAPTCSPKDVR